MNRLSVLIVGIAVCFLTSWVALAMTPYYQIGRLLPDVDDSTGDQAPPGFSGKAEQGRAVYAANGCAYCHTQQMRLGSDVDREWGERSTVARDYIRDVAAYIGDQRTGPDLSNIGSRKPRLGEDPNKYQTAWHYQHLYQPEVVSPGSIMPPMKFLFVKRKVAGQRSLDALKIEGEAAREIGPDEEVVPSEAARQLVAYLQSLKRSGYPLPEAPQPTPAGQ